MDERALSWVDAYIDQLIRMYRDAVFRFILSLDHGNDADAEDITQEAFLRTYAYLRINPVPFQKPQSWLFKTAKNVFYNTIRGRKLVTTESLEQRMVQAAGERDTEPLEILGYEHTQPEAVAQSNEAVATIIQEILALSKNHLKEVMFLLLQEYSYQEIADILVRPLGTVKVHIHHGRKELRMRLKDVETQEERNR